MKKILSLIIAIFPMISMAHDGENHCNPLLQNQMGVATGGQATFGQYDLGTSKFDYFVVSPEFGYSYKNQFLATVRVPFVSLKNNTQSRDFLLSDVQLILQGSVLNWGNTNFLSLGLSSEFPTGNEDKLVGGGHMHFRPYVGIQQNIGHVIGYAQAGFLFAAQQHTEESTDHDHVDGQEAEEESHIHGSVVDVHSSREASFLIGGIVPVSSVVFLNLATSGQTVLTNTNASVGDFYMTVNPGLSLMLNENSTATMFSQIPVTSLQRFDYRFGAGINYIF